MFYRLAKKYFDNKILVEYSHIKYFIKNFITFINDIIL